eukprot:2514312-Pleurochrysis_carterae.AAC.1
MTSSQSDMSRELCPSTLSRDANYGDSHMATRRPAGRARRRPARTRGPQSVVDWETRPRRQRRNFFEIFAIIRKAQALQHKGQYGNEKARILIMSDCLAGLRVIERVWRGKKNIYRKLRNGAVLEALTNIRETLGTVVFMWIPSHVGIIPNVLADNIAIRSQEETPEGMVTGLISKQVKSRPIVYKRKVMGHAELADNPIYQEARRRGKK